MKKLISDQRIFIHELANTLVVAQGMLSIAITMLEKESHINPVIMDKLQRSLARIESTNILLENNRNALMERDKSLKDKKAG
jgi:hypothetical protein